MIKWLVFDVQLGEWPTDVKFFVLGVASVVPGLLKPPDIFPRLINYEKLLRVGLFGIGLDVYWPKFKGLKQRLAGYVRVC